MPEFILPSSGTYENRAVGGRKCGELERHFSFNQSRAAADDKEKIRTDCVNNLNYRAKDRIPGQSHYAATKAGMNGLIDSAALEFAKYNITINGVEPGIFLPKDCRRWVKNTLAPWPRPFRWGGSEPRRTWPTPCCFWFRMKRPGLRERRLLWMVDKYFRKRKFDRKRHPKKRSGVSGATYRLFNFLFSFTRLGGGDGGSCAGFNYLFIQAAARIRISGRVFAVPATGDFRGR